MIRFLQAKDSRVAKAIFIVIIAAVSLGMVVYLIPSFVSGMGANAQDTYAVVYPHWYSKFFSSGATIQQTKVDRMTRQQLMRQNPQYADNPMIIQMFEPRVGQQLVQQQIMLLEAAKLGISASDDDVAQYLHKGQLGEVFFPKGVFIGPDKYKNIINSQANMSVTDFENDLKQGIIIERLQSLITAGVSVGDAEVRDSYRKQNIKIKFDYAVISADDIRKTINPTDAELQAFFLKNGPRYATAVGEQRKITFFSFTPEQLPGGVPQPTQQEIQNYFNQHQAEYQVPEQARSRHILIKVAAGADAKTDAAAKAKAEGILKQIQAGGNFADLASKNSDDPGSKNSGGELGFAKRGAMVPEFDNAIFTQKIGDTQIVKSQFGYHIVQVEERQTAHAQSLNEVLPTIQATLIRQKAAQAESTYAANLASEAGKNGLEKTAAAHHLEVTTTPFIDRRGVVSSLPDGAEVIARAFEAKKGDPPQSAPTGEGYAIFQVADIAPAHAPKFEDYKAQIQDDYRSEQVPLQLSQKTKELADKAKAENDLAKAAQEVGATLKTSDLVGQSGQVPDIGQVGRQAASLFDLSVGSISGPISTQRAGIVAKIVDKQEPSADEIAKNFDRTRDQMLQERRSQAFEIFIGGLSDEYKKNKRVQYNAKNATPELPVK
jgi:peptidyl-prolyl cis-trans isomerase D